MKTKINEIPNKIVINGVQYVLLEERRNSYHRALVLPLNGGSPRWLSNDEVGELKPKE